jgi:vanillate/4-hydroxybenzoate decarboxylase subunit D
MNCPRCDAVETELMTKAPDAWEIYLCRRCTYTWRTSEPEPFLHHDKYDSRFRLKPEQLARFAPFPPVPAASRKRSR